MRCDAIHFHTRYNTENQHYRNISLISQHWMHILPMPNAHFNNLNEIQSFGNNISPMKCCKFNWTADSRVNHISIVFHRIFFYVQFFFLSEINDQIILIQNLDTFHVNESGTDVNYVSMAHPLNEKEQKKWLWALERLRINSLPFESTFGFRICVHIWNRFLAMVRISIRISSPTDSNNDEFMLRPIWILITKNIDFHNECRKSSWNSMNDFVAMPFELFRLSFASLFMQKMMKNTFTSWIRIDYYDWIDFDRLRRAVGVFINIFVPKQRFGSIS